MSAFSKPYRASRSSVVTFPPRPRASPEVNPKVSPLEGLAPRIVELLTMLTYKRPAGSQGEADFIARYVTPLGCTPDAYGNNWLDIPNPDGTRSDVLWSSHTDTVHRTSGAQRIDYAYGIAMSQSGECLGADCTTGVWIMRQMVAAKVPGVYVWHRDEEIGGLGSAWVAKNTPERLAGLRFAIAFDRKGLGDVITDQWTETASTVFAQSLADVLNSHGLKYSPSPNGVFTDTANYADIIPECTNLSVGYYSAHGPMESQDITHACRLADAMVNGDFSGLVVARDPAQDYGRNLGGYDPWDDDADREFQPDPGSNSMEDFVWDRTKDVAKFLECQGFTVGDIKQFIGGL